MSGELLPSTERDLVAARAALTRHGVVIIRTIETELEPAVMAAVRRSIASSGRNLSKLDDDTLDRLMNETREAVRGSAEDLQRLYTRILAELGSEDVSQLLKELEGMDQLFRWDRILRASEAPNKVLAEKGFDPAELSGPEDLSEAFKLELEERWPSAFKEFRRMVAAAMKEMSEKADGAEPKGPSKGSKRKKRQ